MFWIKTSVFFLLALSPVWPLGSAAETGDPFVIINKTSNTLALVEHGKIVKTFPVATGKEDRLTPVGSFTVTVKAVNPYYRKANIPGGDKDNPLGSRWIGFDARNTDGRMYGIHGSNNPASIGTYASNGCVRMLEDDVQYVYDHIPGGAAVIVVKSKYGFDDILRHLKSQ
ncbi:L,D-transpeptidase [Fictibacillus iocasae]|uniref:L,D-transpeptidase n=1 Tax=Fictibacillus iocasae TaxID=2715437 RepID=A0ABW2NMX3_9BACL